MQELLNKQLHKDVEVILVNWKLCLDLLKILFVTIKGCKSGNPFCWGNLMQ